MTQEGWLYEAARWFWLSVLALIGILARHAHNSVSNGKIEWRPFLTDALTAPFLGIVAGAGATWFGVPDFDKMAIVALVGFLGPAFVRATSEMLRDFLVKKASEK